MYIYTGLTDRMFPYQIGPVLLLTSSVHAHHPLVDSHVCTPVYWYLEYTGVFPTPVIFIFVLSFADNHHHHPWTWAYMLVFDSGCCLPPVPPPSPPPSNTSAYAHLQSLFATTTATATITTLENELICSFSRVVLTSTTLQCKCTVCSF